MHWLIAHIIGDFILQNDFIVYLKRKGLMYGLVHAILYIIPFLFCKLHWISIVAIFIQHWIQDSTNFITWFCRVTKKFQHPDLHQWGLILIDNVVHIIWLYFISDIVNPLLVC
jgi:hypothetical protein